MTDETRANNRRWYDSARVIGGLFFVLYGCVGAWAAVTNNQIGAMDDRLRTVEIQSAEMRSDLRAIRSALESMDRKLDRIEGR